MNKWQPKYRNKKIIIDGHLFDSQKEGRYYLYLRDQKAKGKIVEFDMQVRFDLLDAQYEMDKCIERGVFYKCDFLVTNNDYTKDVIDVKCHATKTPYYKLKRKLMFYIHGIRIKEV